LVGGVDPVLPLPEQQALDLGRGQLPPRRLHRSVAEPRRGVLISLMQVADRNRLGVVKRGVPGGPWNSGRRSGVSARFAVVPSQGDAPWPCRKSSPPTKSTPR
jgi:hypothetical protein